MTFLLFQQYCVYRYVCVDCAVIGMAEEGDEAQAAAELFSIMYQHTDG